MEGVVVPRKESFHRNVDRADRPGAGIADDDANLFGIRQNRYIALQGHSCLGEKLVLLLLEIDAKVLLVAYEDVASGVALDKCHVQRPLLTIAGFLEQELDGVKGNL